MGKISSAVESILCPWCLRFRFSPIHLLTRVAGLCDSGASYASGGTLPKLDWGGDDSVALLYDANGHWRSKD